MLEKLRWGRRRRHNEGVATALLLKYHHGHICHNWELVPILNTVCRWESAQYGTLWSVRGNLGAGAAHFRGRAPQISNTPSQTDKFMRFEPLASIRYSIFWIGFILWCPVRLRRASNPLLLNVRIDRSSYGVMPFVRRSSPRF